MRSVAPLLLLLTAAACSSGPDRPSPSESGSPGQSAPAGAELEALGIYNLGRPLPGLYTAGQVTEEQVRAMAGRKVRLINLRSDGEWGTGWEEAVAAEVGLRYEHLPIDGADAIDEANARRLGELLAQRPADSVDLLYCGSSERVGALLGLKAAVVDGLPAEAAFELGVAGGATSMRPLLRRRLGLRE